MTAVPWSSASAKRAARFKTFPIVYTRFSNAIQYVPGERRTLTFVLGKAKDGREVQEVCDEIKAQTSLAAYTHENLSG